MSRTVLDLKSDLMRKAQKLTGITKKAELVNFVLEALVRQKEIEEILHLRGRVQWKGSLRKIRANRF